jgi:hypothetical protein
MASSSSGSPDACGDGITRPGSTVWALRGCAITESDGAKIGEWRDQNNAVFSGLGKVVSAGGKKGVEIAPTNDFTMPDDAAGASALRSETFCAVVVATYTLLSGTPSAHAHLPLLSKQSTTDGSNGFWLEASSNPVFSSTANPTKVGFRTGQDYLQRSSSESAQHVYRVERVGALLTFSVDELSQSPISMKNPAIDYGAPGAPVMLGGHSSDAFGNFNGRIFEVWMLKGQATGDCSGLASSLKAAYRIP